MNFEFLISFIGSVIDSLHWAVSATVHCGWVAAFAGWSRLLYSTSVLILCLRISEDSDCWLRLPETDFQSSVPAIKWRQADKLFRLVHCYKGLLLLHTIADRQIVLSGGKVSFSWLNRFVNSQNVIQASQINFSCWEEYIFSLPQNLVTSWHPASAVSAGTLNLCRHSIISMTDLQWFHYHDFSPTSALQPSFWRISVDGLSVVCWTRLPFGTILFDRPALRSLIMR